MHITQGECHQKVAAASKKAAQTQDSMTKAAAYMDSYCFCTERYRNGVRHM